MSYSQPVLASLAVGAWSTLTRLVVERPERSFDTGSETLRLTSALDALHALHELGLLGWWMSNEAAQELGEAVGRHGALVRCRFIDCKVKPYRGIDHRDVEGGLRAVERLYGEDSTRLVAQLLRYVSPRSLALLGIECDTRVAPFVLRRPTLLFCDQGIRTLWPMLSKMPVEELYYDVAFAAHDVHVLDAIAHSLNHDASACARLRAIVGVFGGHEMVDMSRESNARRAMSLGFAMGGAQGALNRRHPGSLERPSVELSVRIRRLFDPPVSASVRRRIYWPS